MFFALEVLYALVLLATRPIGEGQVAPYAGRDGQSYRWQESACPLGVSVM